MKKKLLIVPLMVMGVLVLSEFGAATIISNMTTKMSTSTIDNHPPTMPEIRGPTFVRPGIHYWTFRAFDPDGDDVSYEVEWGDGWYGDIWYGWYASHEVISLGHDYQGYYGYIKLLARAKDIHNATSDWGTISIVLPENYHMPNSLILPFLSRFMERFQR